jgi:hypothetical protein
MVEPDGFGGGSIDSKNTLSIETEGLVTIHKIDETSNSDEEEDDESGMVSRAHMRL